MGASVGDYEVFLSFRGSDTRQGLTDVLYDYMDNAKIRVFRDDKALQIGDRIDSIFEAIVNSKICVPVFSPNFAQSRYCMLEVTKMVELKKTIVPIFCNVTPDDVKLKTSLYVDDFQKLEDKYGKHQVDMWKEALREVVTYKGRKVGDKGYSQFSKEFVVELLSKLRHRDLESSSSSSHHEAVSVGIDGMSRGVAGLGGPVTVIGQEFVAAYPIELIFRKPGVFNVDVTDPKGAIIFKVKTILLKLSEELLDISGKTLVTMQQKVYHLSLDMHAYRGKSTNKNDFLFKMKSQKGMEFVQFKTDYTFKHYVYLGQNTNDDVWDYRLEGNWSEKKCVIYAGKTNNIVVQIKPKEETVQSEMVRNDYFGVTVPPHIDYAFIVALLVCSECERYFFVKS